MTRERLIASTAYGLLAVIAAGTFLMPETLTVPSSAAAGASDTIRLRGVVRDFRRGDVDFNVAPDAGYGHYAGNVSETLGSDGRPLFVGASHPVTNFTVINQVVTPAEDYVVEATVLGAAIYSGSYHRPVTAKLQIGADVFEPFGPFAQPVEGNVNDDQSGTGHQNPGSNPRIEVLPQTFPAGTPLYVVGKSWQKVDSDDSGMENSHWETKKEASTEHDSVQIKVLVDGDPVPNNDGDYDQESIEAFISDYVDFDTATMDLGPHQIIYLYELAATGPDDGDFQDLVVLVSLAADAGYYEDEDENPGGGGVTGGYRVNAQWTDNAGNNIAPHTYIENGLDAGGNPITDNAGTKGAADHGGIDSPASFAEWFTDVPGRNASAAEPITLTRDGAGVYTFVTDDFHPIDDRLLGNEGDAHNHYFTYMLTAKFVYKAGWQQFVHFSGGDGAWLFIDDQLALDLGGVRSGVDQQVSLDRLGLTDGQTFTMRLFYAQRDSTSSGFRLRTTVDLEPSSVPPTISAAFD